HRVAGQHQFGERHYMGADLGGLGAPAPNQGGVTGDVADGRVYLGERKAQLRHTPIIPHRWRGHTPVSGASATGRAARARSPGAAPPAPPPTARGPGPPAKTRTAGTPPAPPGPAPATRSGPPSGWRQ